jgi:peptide/nickel transport system ATP-binding protein
MMRLTTGAPLLEIRDLAISFESGRGRVPAVTGLSLALHAGRTFGLVGESGCGKSVTALSILRLLQAETAHVSGQILFQGTDLLTLDADQMRDIRGNRIAMIFQEPMTSLNPAYTVGDQIGEALMRHKGLSKRAARAQAIELLSRVKIPAPQARVDAYPHNLSGGMRQRVMIAMALALEPALLIADEPTTALDVTIQAQVLDLIRDLARDMGTAVLLITHDLGVVAEMCDDVGVMYAGELVEAAPVAELFAAPEHPYTAGLLGALPRLDDRRARLATIKGAVPSLVGLGDGCRFAARCPFVETACYATALPLHATTPAHYTRCRRAPLAEIAA